MDEQSVYHRDIKPENFLLDQDFNLVLTDFGSATCNLKSQKKVGTTIYMSPEVYKGMEYNSLLNDIYSSAVIAFVLITGLIPQDQRVPFYLSLGLEKDFSSFWNKIGTKVSKEFRDLFERILVPQSLRMTLEEVINHKWF